MAKAKAKKNRYARNAPRHGMTEKQWKAAMRKSIASNIAERMADPSTQDKMLNLIAILAAAKPSKY